MEVGDGTDLADAAVAFIVARPVDEDSPIAPCRARCLALLAPVLLGCAGVQSALDPAGIEAARIATLSWVLFIGAGAIALLVFALAGWAMFARPASKRLLAKRGFVIGGGIVFPVVTLTALLLYSLPLFRSEARTGETPLHVEITGEQFWWRMRYLEDAGRPGFGSANELVVPVGRPVSLRLKTADVIHSLWIPALAGKLDMIPGRENVLDIRAARPGIYRGQCAEFCGTQHALMAFDVLALEPAEFQRWRAARATAAVEPAGDFLVRGKSLFFTGGCGNCHEVRGTPAAGKLGPDLTHVGSRRTIAAGSFPNNVGTIAGWIADAQHLKPGNRMPSYSSLSGEDLRALAAYMASLK